MADNLIVVDARGDKTPVDLSVDTYKQATEAGISLGQFLAQRYPVNADRDGTVMQQLMEQTGILTQGNAEFGLRPSTVEQVLNPKEANNGSVITRDGIPASRLLFPAVILDIIEDKLKVDLETNPNALNGMLAVNDSIQGDRFERPVLNYSKPEAARAAPVAQLSLPNAMLTITASDRSMRIPNWGIGLEISEQAQRSTTIDLVGLAVARQAAVEANERANGYILSLLNGDSDLAMAALSSFAGKVQTAVSLDAAATTGLTQRAWLRWLSQRSNKRTITHIVTDLNGAMTIEGRVGKPTVQTDNPNSRRIDTLFEVVNPKWPANVKVFLTDDPNWPANTIMGMDSRYGIHRVSSLTAQYSAIEQFVLKRSTAMRIDKGEIYYRLFDEAFEVLTYA